jgi:uncharacterized protein (TIGR03083 family)
LADELGSNPSRTGLRLSDLISSLRREGEILAAAADRAGPDAQVPTCPRWRVRDLVHHTGGVHRWATAHVAEQRQEPMGPEETEALMAHQPGDDLLLAWFRAGHEDLVDALKQASPQLTCWTFLPAPSPLVFWARRQAHETEIHRADAELASGPITPISTPVALDGIEEILFGFAARHGRLAVDRPRRLRLTASDADAEWLVQIGPAGVEASRGGGESDCHVGDSASNLFLLLWNRRLGNGPEVKGDRRVIELWRLSIQVRWS